MAILVVDFLISEPSLREKKPPTNALIPLNYQHMLQKKHQKKLTQQKPTTKKQNKTQKTHGFAPAKQPHPPSPCPGWNPPPLKPAYPKRWNESPLESVDLRLEARWCSPTTQGSPLLSAPWCQCLDLNHPGWTQVKWMANVHILNSELCIYRPYAINIYI